MPPPSPAALPVAAACWRRADWLAREAAHRQRVAAMADAFVDRRSRGQKHPVHDFLFTYYSFAPAKLKQWLPPSDTAIEVQAGDLAERPWLTRPPYRQDGDRVSQDPAAMPAAKRDLARWVASLCAGILERAPRFACFGLHEWAMVYRQSREQIRHQGYELRLAPEELARFVESQNLGCTHYDAYRFFTPEARPLNALQPTLETRLDLEQGACLHANMDLYKWATKLWPWIGSDLVGEAFALACAGRDLDMRASPYDLRHLGYEQVCIETAAGREQYQAEQRALAAQAEPLRERLRQAALHLTEPTSGQA